MVDPPGELEVGFDHRDHGKSYAAACLALILDPIDRGFPPA
jgi:hypothetical protein